MPSPARRRAADPETRTRAQIAADEVQRELVAEAVCAVIAAEGMEAATLRRVAAELESTTGLISHYFRNKDEMLIHALQHATRKIGSVVGASGEQPPTTLEEYLRAYCRALPVDPVRNQYWKVYAAFRTAALCSPRLEQYLAEYGDHQASVYRPMLAVATGRTVDDPVVDRLELALDALLEGFGFAATEQPDQFAPAQVLESLTVAVEAWIAHARV